MGTAQHKLAVCSGVEKPVCCRPQIASLPVSESLIVATSSGNASNS
jgi:hypothetical protein